MFISFYCLGNRRNIKSYNLKCCDRLFKLWVSDMITWFLFQRYFDIKWDRLSIFENNNKNICHSYNWKHLISRSILLFNQITKRIMIRIWNKKRSLIKTEFKNVMLLNLSWTWKCSSISWNLVTNCTS